MNAYCNQRKIEGPRVSEGLALTWCVLSLLTSLFFFLSLLIIVSRPPSTWLMLCLLTLVPCLGLMIAGVVIWINLYKQFTDTATRITEVKSR